MKSKDLKENKKFMKSMGKSAEYVKKMTAKNISDKDYRRNERWAKYWAKKGYESLSQTQRDEYIATRNYNVPSLGTTPQNYGDHFANEMTQRLLGKRTRSGQNAAARSRQSKVNVSSKTAANILANSRMSNTREDLGKKAFLKGMRHESEDGYRDLLTKLGKKKNSSYASLLVSFDYKGGNRTEGYTYTCKAKDGVVYEIRTPGYDPKDGRQHGYQIRVLGDEDWIDMR